MAECTCCNTKGNQEQDVHTSSRSRAWHSLCRRSRAEAECLVADVHFALDADDDADGLLRELCRSLLTEHADNRRTGVEIGKLFHRSEEHTSELQSLRQLV